MEGTEAQEDTAGHILKVQHNMHIVPVTCFAISLHGLVNRSVFNNWFPTLERIIWKQSDLWLQIMCHDCQLSAVGSKTPGSNPPGSNPPRVESAGSNAPGRMRRGRTVRLPELQLSQKGPDRLSFPFGISLYHVWRAHWLIAWSLPPFLINVRTFDF